MILEFGVIAQPDFPGSPTKKFTLNSSQHWAFVVSIDTQAIFMNISGLKFVILVLTSIAQMTLSSEYGKQQLKVVILMTRLLFP